MKLLHRLSALAMTAVMAFSISGGASAADAVTATIDTGRSTSLTLYKYDLTGAENDGVWDSQSYVSTGIADEQVNTALSQYAIQGVEFTYRKLADLSIYKGTAADGHQETVPLYAFTENTPWRGWPTLTRKARTPSAPLSWSWRKPDTSLATKLLQRAAGLAATNM